MELEGVAAIITQFAEYISALLSYLKEFFNSIMKKNDAAPADESTSAAE